MEKGLISVVVPVYNGESGIKRCLESLTAQTYKNTEIIVINDGSTDNTAKIIEDFASRDKRIKPFHIENGGVSNARNIGIENSQGEFIMFTDGDDTLEPETLKIMADKMGENTDFVHCGMRKITENGEKLFWEKKLNAKKAEGQNLILAEFFRKNIMSTSCAKLYRRSTVADIRFDRNFAVGEDELFSFYICSNSKEAVIIENVFYNYIENSDSVMNKNFSDKHFQALSVMDIQLDKVKDNKELYRLASLCDAERSNELMWKMFDTKKMYHKFGFLRERMLSHKKYYLTAKEYSIKDKVLYILLWLMPKTYYKLKLKQNS